MKPIVVMGLVAGLGVAGCGSRVTKRISATVARNAVAVGAVKEFRDRHHPLDGLPTCTAKPIGGSDTKMNVRCRGTTKAGETVTLTGHTNGANEVRGSFTGLVAGKQVFTTTCIGC
jgi:hypothetical protein